MRPESMKARLEEGGGGVVMVVVVVVDASEGVAAMGDCCWRLEEVRAMAVPAPTTRPPAKRLLFGLVVLLLRMR